MSQPNWWKTACAVCALSAATAIALPAQTLTTLFSFDNVHGAYPAAGLVQATDGNLYGTTLQGGTHVCLFEYAGCGTVFKITPDGTLTRVYSFCKQSNCTDGGEPRAALVQATDGNLYGTTEYGGAAVCEYGCGTLFKITPSGTLTTLYSFCSQTDCTDGYYPQAELVQATNGSFYGTTPAGSNGGPLNYGTVFKVTPSGTLATLYSFCSQPLCTDGENPMAALVQATDGNFYGTTEYGGVNDAGYGGDGTVFKITPSGTLTTIYSFCSQPNCTDGAYPAAGLVQGTDGNFYGTTETGGNLNDCNRAGCGTVFQISHGVLTTIHSFDYLDGAYPNAALLQATDGTFYGTTHEGGDSIACADGCGTAFKITPGGTLTTLYSFCSQTGCTDGNSPEGSLLQDTNGQLYGTTSEGGTSSACSANGCGTVFGLSVGLGPFVETRPTSGGVGRPVEILGTNLTGATSVTFNGTAATFTVESSSVITTTVPAGATTGTVQVVTPGGTLSSNVPFRVLP